MTQVGKNKLDHPSLGTAGGSALHSQMESIFTTISDNLPARWKLFSSIANGTTQTYEHNLQVPLSDLRLHIYTTSGGVQTRLTDLTGWTVAATSGYEQSKIDITVPSSGGPFTFYVFISHEPMSDKLDLAGGTLTGPLLLAADPTLALHAATKQYVDNLAQGLDVKASVRAATTANITLSGTQTIDGVSVVAGDRVLVKNQTTQSQNGIYVVAAGGWSRATDMDAWGEVPGAFVFVEEGSTLKDTGWVCTADQGGTIGTTAMAWSQFAGVGSVTASGGGIQISGNDISLALNGSTLDKTSGLRLNPACDAVVGTLQTGAITATAHADFTAIATPANPTAGKLRAYAKSDNKLYTLNSSGIEQAVGSGGSIVLITKTSHGFVAADVGCPVYINGSGDYVKARADVVATAEVAGLINRIVDANNFEVCLGGEVSSVGANAASPLTVGELYFLSPTTAGALTVVEPSVVGQVSKPVGIARTSSAIEFFNMRGVVVGGTNVRTQLSLAVQNTAQNIQDVSAYDAGELTGWVYVDQATDARFYVAAQFSKAGAGNNYNVSYQTSGDTPPSGFSLSVTAAGMLQLTLASSVSGITAATINYALNAPAVGVTLPLSIDASLVATGTMDSARLPAASASAPGIVTTSAQTFAGKKTFSEINLKQDESIGIKSLFGQGGGGTYPNMQIDSRQVFNGNAAAATNLWAINFESSYSAVYVVIRGSLTRNNNNPFCVYGEYTVVNAGGTVTITAIGTPNAIGTSTASNRALFTVNAAGASSLVNVNATIMVFGGGENAGALSTKTFTVERT